MSYYTGLGVLYKQDSSGVLIDCDSWNNFFQSPCWNPFAPTVVPAPPAVGSGDGSGVAPVPLYPATAAPPDTTVPPCTFLGIGCTTLAIAGGAIFLGFFILGMQKARR